jgi:tetratricopeptide (TPR) repeat protein
VTAAPRIIGVVALLLAGSPAPAAVQDVSSLPGVSQWTGAVLGHPAGDGDPQRHVAELLGRGDDAGALAYVRGLAARQPDVAATLHEMLAAAYVRDRRLYRAQQHLDSIPADRATEQARYLGAIIAARQQRLEDAARTFDALARQSPADPVVARDQAQVASLLGRHETAATAAARLRKLRPNDGWAALLEARMRMQQGRAEEAGRLLEALLEREPGNGNASLSLGLLRLSQARVSDARACFIAARSIGGRNAVPYAAEAVAAALLGEAGQARAASTGALQQNPADPLAALVAVLVGDAAARPATAGSPRYVAATLYPDLDPEPLPAPIGAELVTAREAAEVAAANLLLEQWSGKVALGALDGGDRPASGGPLRGFTAVRAAIAAGETRKATERLAAFERTPAMHGLAGTDVLAASLAARRGDAAGAREAMDRALAVRPDSPRLRALAGDLELAAGQPGRAIQQYRKALEGWPSDPRLLNQLAAALALAGSRDEWLEALSFAERGLAARPHYLLRAQLLDTRADLLFRLGRRSEALEAYRALSTTVGGMTTPEQWHRLATLEVAAGDAAGARRAFEEALDYGRPYPGREQAMRVLDAPVEAEAGAK